MVKMSNVKYARFATVFFTVILAFFVLSNYLNEDYRGAAFMAFGAIGWAVMAMIVWNHESIDMAIPIFIVELVGLTWYWIFYGGHEGFGIFWNMILPIFICYGFDIIPSCILCTLILGEMVVLLWTPLSVYAYQYTPVVRQWAPLLFGMIFVGAVFMKNQVNGLIKRQQKMVKEADEANRAKGVFIANTSDKIKNSLDTISEMTERIAEESRDERIRSYVSTINASNASLLAVIDDILDISKIESGKMEVSNEKYYLSDLLKECYKLVSAQCHYKGNELVIDCDKKLPEVLLGDNKHIRQILVNLLENSVKFTHDGTITLEVSGRTVLDIVELQFTVRDTGVGMDEEKLKSIIKRFEVEEDLKKIDYDDSGLGLLITAHLAHLLGAEVEISSVVNQGTTFSITLQQRKMEEKRVGEIDFN